MRIFADTADLDEIERLSEDAWVSGFTTNPTLAKNYIDNVINVDGLKYREWAKSAVELANGKSISIDGPVEKVWELGENAVAKVCIDSYTDPKTAVMVKDRGPINWTAVCYWHQFRGVIPTNHDIISVFAGRIMDTGRDPYKEFRKLKGWSGQMLWASCRELYHYQLAQDAGCDIITMAPAQIDKLKEWWGMPLEHVAELTIKQFNDDRPEW